jgi:predicted RND superfamily exporter protein
MLKNVGENQFKKYTVVCIAGLLILTGFFLMGFSKIEADYDFEKFFPMSDEETDFFNTYRDKFESDNDFLLIALENSPTVFDWKFLNKVKKFQDTLSKIDNVVFARSIVSEREMYIFPGGGGTATRPYINFEEKHLDKDERDLMENVEMVNTFVAKDKKSICLFVRHDDFLSKKKSDDLIKNINSFIPKFKFEKVRMAGRTVGQKFYIDTMSYEMLLFISLSFVLILFFLFIAFRSGWGLLMPQLVLFGTVIWVVGFIGWYGEPVSIIMSVLPSIIFVVGMSDVIHVMSRYLDAFRTGIGKFESIKLTIREVGMATFLTSFTTAIGFFSLYFVNVQPIQVFGLVAGVGVMIAFALTFLLLPILIYYFPDPKYIRTSHQDPFWSKRLRKWFLYALRNTKKIMAISAVLIVILIFGGIQMKSNNYLMDEISQNAPMKKDFNYLDKHYGGVRPFEAAIQLKDKNADFWDKETLQQLEKLEENLEEEYGVLIKFSLVKTVKLINRSSHAGRTDYYSIPDQQRIINRFQKPIKRAGRGKLYAGFMDSIGTTSRISGTIPDWGNIKITAKNKKFTEYLKTSGLDKIVDVQITGTAHLLDKNINYLSASLVKGLSVSVLIVALVMGLLYRSVSMVVLSIIPNLIPLLFIAGIMGYFGINLKTSTSIIFTIAFGIAVDDTIHFLGKFKFELLKGRSKLYALKRSYLTTGKAMIITTFILCAGFILLVFSSFQGTVIMGLLLCLTLFIALIADLTLLPVLLMLFYRKGK